MVTVRKESGMYYDYENPHKGRSTRICLYVCVCVKGAGVTVFNIVLIYAHRLTSVTIRKVYSRWVGIIMQHMLMINKTSFSFIYNLYTFEVM